MKAGQLEFALTSETNRAGLNLWLWAGAIALACFAPLFLMAAGVDFSTTSIPLTPLSADGLSQADLREASHADLRGSYTHMLFEWTATTFALFLFVLAFIRSRHTRDASPAVIGLARICGGAMDAFHVLAATRLIDSVADNRACRSFRILPRSSIWHSDRRDFTTPLSTLRTLSRPSPTPSRLPVYASITWPTMMA